jgi:DNA-binding transcriptional ArsR family regulator
MSTTERKPPIPLAIPETRAALARMYLELTIAFHATIFPLEQTPSKLDANLTAVAVAVMLGHADGNPMNATELTSILRMSRTSVQRRLDVLIAHGIIHRVEDRYFLDQVRAATVPYRDRFELILSKGFAVIGAHLSKMDTPKMGT